MSRDYPTLDEQYGPGAEQADAEAQDDIATELQEAIDSPSEYNHRYWTEVAARAIEKLQRQDNRIRKAQSIIGDISGDIKIFKPEMRDRILAFLAPTAADTEAKG